MVLLHFKAMQFRRYHRTWHGFVNDNTNETHPRGLKLLYCFAPLVKRSPIQLGCLKCLGSHGCSVSDEDATHPSSSTAFLCSLVDITKSCSTSLRIIQGIHKSQQRFFLVKDPVVSPFSRSCEIALDHGPKRGQLCVIVRFFSNGATWKFVSYSEDDEVREAKAISAMTPQRRAGNCRLRWRLQEFWNLRVTVNTCLVTLKILKLENILVI